MGGDNSEYFSFKAKGLMKNPSIVLNTNYETLNFPPTSMVLVFNHNSGLYSEQDRERLFAYMKKLNVTVKEAVVQIGY